MAKTFHGDSSGTGTGELRGLRGEMDIRIAPDGSHSYAFDYPLEG